MEKALSDTRRRTIILALVHRGPMSIVFWLWTGAGIIDQALLRVPAWEFNKLWAAIMSWSPDDRWRWWLIGALCFGVFATAEGAIRLVRRIAEEHTTETHALRQTDEMRIVQKLSETFMENHREWRGKEGYRKVTSAHLLAAIHRFHPFGFNENEARKLVARMLCKTVRKDNASAFALAQAIANEHLLEQPQTASFTTVVMYADAADASARHALTEKAREAARLFEGTCGEYDRELVMCAAPRRLLGSIRKRRK